MAQKLITITPDIKNVVHYHIFSLLIFSIFLSLYCNGMEQNTITIKNNLSRLLFDANHHPTPALLQLLKETNTPHKGTLDSIFTVTQQCWLRPAGKERWEIENRFTNASKNLPQLFEKLSLINTIHPSQKNYTYALLLGDADATTMRMRIKNLIKIWNKGVRFNSLYILTGTQPLDEKVASKEIFLQCTIKNFPLNKNWQFNGNLPTTETKMIQFFLDQAILPAEWNDLPIVFVNTPMQPTKNGTLKRPTTLDTINEWLKLHNPQPSSILAISIQPYVAYQDSVLRDTLRSSFTIETVGNKYPADQNIPIMLDSVARWIYHEYHIHKSAKY